MEVFWDLPWAVPGGGVHDTKGTMTFVRYAITDK